MNSGPQERANAAFDRHAAFETANGGFRLTTAAFESHVTGSGAAEQTVRYRVTVRVPMLSRVIDGELGPSVLEGWFETFERRLEDAPMATRADITLESYTVDRRDGEAIVTFEFEDTVPDRGPNVVKALIEFTEGTYVEGVVPGYEYRDPVASLISRARQGEDESGPMPL